MLPSQTLAGRYGWAALVALWLLLALGPLPFGAVDIWALGGLLAGCGLLGILLAADLWSRPRAMPADVWLAVGFLALTLIGSVFSQAGPHSVNRLTLIAALTVVYIAVRLLVHGRLVLVTVMVMLSVAVAATCYGLIETLSGHNFVLWAQKRAYRDSVTGVFINRNHFAAFLLLNVYAATGVLFAPAGRHSIRALAAGALAVLSCGLALTLSRGGLLAAVAAAPVFFLLLGGRRLGLKTIVVGALAPLSLAAVLVSVTGGGRLAERFTTSFDAGEGISITMRISIWRSCLEAVAEHPIVGWGPGSFTSVFPLFRAADVVGRVQYAHNDYLELLVERGVGGALVVALLLAGYAICSRRAQPLPELATLRAGLVAGMVGLAAHAVVDFSLKIPAVALYATVAAGLSLACATNSSAMALLRLRRPLATTAITILGLALIARGCALWASDRAHARARPLFAEVEWEEAIAEERRALAWDPLSLAAQEGLARALQNQMKFTRDKQLKQERITTALAAFERAVRLDPLSAELRLQLGWLYNFLGQRDKALEQLQTAANMDKNNANIQYQLAFALLHAGQLETGHARMRRAIELYPNLFGGKIHELHYVLGGPSSVLDLVPDDQPFLAYQYSLFLAGKAELDTAVPLFDRLYQQEGRREDWLIPFAETLGRAAGSAAAAEFLAERASGDPSAALIAQRVRHLLGAGRRTEALELARANEQRWTLDIGLLESRVSLELAHGGHAEARDVAARYLAAGGACDTYQSLISGIESSLERHHEAVEACFAVLACQAPREATLRLAHEQLARQRQLAQKRGDVTLLKRIADGLGKLPQAGD